LLIFRFLTGVSLAGIYPIGMKIAADYFKEGLGTTLGYLVGALVLGTSFPHFIKSINQSFSWETVIIATSSLAFIGGLIVLLFIPDGPFRQKNNKPNFKTFFTLFKNNKFRISAFGYFGHMWELYAFWTFTPLIISMYLKKQPSLDYSVSLLSFFIIAIGSLACITAGYLSVKFETKIVARTFLILSAICCLLFPLFYQLSPPTFFIFLLFWGFVVIGDSPLFSTLVAQNTSSDTKGTALTIVNSIGFTITIISIQLITYLLDNTTSISLFTLLAIGPILGLIGLFTKTKKRIV
jgi:MFS family permease